MASARIDLTVWGKLQRLQPKILIFTFGASLLPVVFILGLAWRFLYEPLTELEKTRLDDQVLAFQGYTSATEKGLRNLGKSYAVWTDLYNAIAQKNRSWIRAEVTDQLVFTTDIDAVEVKSRTGEILGQRGEALRSSIVRQRLKTLIAQEKPGKKIVALGDRSVLILITEPVFRTDGSGKSPGTLIIGQVLDNDWSRQFLNYSQPTTQLTILSLTNQSVVSSSERASLDAWEQNNLTKTVLPAIEKSESIYRLEPESGFNTVYAPILSGKKPVAIAKIQISSLYFKNATAALTRVVWFGLGFAVVLSIAIAHLLSKQIASPINQLALRSKTLAAGDLNSPIPGLNAGGEIGQLANAYQDMAAALKTLINNLEHRVAERTEELELAKQTLEDRVQQRTEELLQKNQQLQQASEKLTQLNTMLTDQAQQLEQALLNLKKAQAQLIQTEKMSSLGQLVAGIAHEINNPINFIYANLFHVSDYTQHLLDLIYLYQQRYSDAEISQQIDSIELDFLIDDLPKILASMQTGAERISKIVDTLKNFARFDEAGTKRVNLHEGIDSTLLILQNHFRTPDGYPEIQVIRNYSELPKVECYPKQLNQIFINILNNAIDALKESLNQGKYSSGNCPIIEIRTEKIEQTVVVKIWNNGSEISPAVLSRIFDPFYTTKPVGKGTGLGLSICYQMIENHNGSIGVTSQPGQGTEFTISLPIQQS